MNYLSCAIEHINSEDVWPTTIALFTLIIGNYQQIPNEIMRSQGENKNRTHIDTGVYFNYVANKLGRMGKNRKMGHFCTIFKIKFLSLKLILLLP